MIRCGTVGDVVGAIGVSHQVAAPIRTGIHVRVTLLQQAVLSRPMEIQDQRQGDTVGGRGGGTWSR